MRHDAVRVLCGRGVTQCRERHTHGHTQRTLGMDGPSGGVHCPAFTDPALGSASCRGRDVLSRVAVCTCSAAHTATATTRHHQRHEHKPTAGREVRIIQGEWGVANSSLRGAKSFREWGGVQPTAGREVRNHKMASRPVRRVDTHSQKKGTL